MACTITIKCTITPRARFSLPLTIIFPGRCSRVGRSAAVGRRRRRRYTRGRNSTARGPAGKAGMEVARGGLASQSEGARERGESRSGGGGREGGGQRASFSHLPGSRSLARSLVLGLLNFVLSDGRRRRLRSLPLSSSADGSRFFPAAHNVQRHHPSEVGREGLLGSAGGGALSFLSLCLSLGPPGIGRRTTAATGSSPSLRWRT